MLMVSDLQIVLDKKKALRSVARARETADIMVENILKFPSVANGLYIAILRYICIIMKAFLGG